VVIAAQSAAMILHELRFGFARAAVRKDGETAFGLLRGREGRALSSLLQQTMGMMIVIHMIQIRLLRIWP
jgi:hypothetical protein